jgi:hypothetical protein
LTIDSRTPQPFDRLRASTESRRTARRFLFSVKLIRLSRLGKD